MLKAFPTLHHGASRYFEPNTLKNSPIYCLALMQLGNHPYGPYKVISSNIKIFKLQIAGKEYVTSIDRLKPTSIFQ